MHKLYTVQILLYLRRLFFVWLQVLSYLRTCGRARSWSEKQRLQNLWTKKGYDLAFKACDCRCGKGHIRKDLDHVPFANARRADDRRAAKKNRRKYYSTSSIGGVCSSQAVGGGVRYSFSGGSSSTGGDVRSPPLRVRTSSLCSTGSSPPSSADGTPPITPGSLIVAAGLMGGSKQGGGGGKQKFDFFADLGQAAAGNIFNQRTDMSVFKNLPRIKRNTHQIKVLTTRLLINRS